MKKVTRVLYLCAISLTLLACSKDAVEDMETANLTAKVQPVSYSTIELEILDLVNAHREQNSLNTLQIMDEGSIQAAIHNQHMIDNDEVCHDYFGQRYNALVEAVKAKAVSENVAFGYSSAESVVNAWMNSDSHRENLLGDHTHFGISVREGQDGKYYFTNIFVRK